MLEKIKKNWFTVLLICLLVAALVCVRAFETQLFYDPLLEFFKGEMTQKPLPEINFVKLSLHYFLRFVINSALSLVIIFLLFRSWSQVKFASILYVAFFIVLLSSFLIVINLNDNNLYLVIFYIRRFIIQPLFLILFAAAFYYQKLLNNKM